MTFDLDATWLIAKLSGGALALLIFAAGWMVARTVHKIVVRASNARRFDVALTAFLANLIRYAILAATIIAAMDTVGVETTSLIALFASAGIAIGLALQGSLSNFASGVLILVLRPFDIDQVVTISGQTGKVTDIGLFATTMIGAGNEQIIVPNSSVTSDVIINLTSQSSRRGVVQVGVAYGANVDEVVPVLLRAAARVPVVLGTPAPEIRFTGLGASSLDFEVLVWSTPENYWPMLHGVRKAVYEELTLAAIEIPFNQVVVHQANAEVEKIVADYKLPAVSAPAE